MNFIKRFFVVVLLFASNFSFGSTIYGKILDSDSVPLAFSTVYLKNSTYGVNADFNGNYFMELEPGNYTLVFSFLGHKTVEKEITLKYNENKKIDVVLRKTDVEIFQIEVVADKVDKAKKIMKKAREQRRGYFTSVDNFKCKSYVKTSIENEFEKEKVDSTLDEKDFETYLKKESLNLIEYVADTYYKRPNKFKEVILAYHDFTEAKPLGMYVTVGLEENYGESDIAPKSYMPENPHVFYKNITSANFNFYENQINLPTLCNQPLVSPLAYNSNLFYNFEFKSSFFENGLKVNKIKVEPKNNVSALFYGNIFVEDSTWALVSVDLYINEKSLLTYKNFNIIQNYQRFDDSIYLPIRTEIIYTIPGEKKKV